MSLSATARRSLSAHDVPSCRGASGEACPGGGFVLVEGPEELEVPPAAVAVDWAPPVAPWAAPAVFAFAPAAWVHPQKTLSNRSSPARTCVLTASSRHF